MSNRLSLADLNPRNQAEVMRQLHPEAPVASEGKRLRQNTRGLNKTETDFLAYCRSTLICPPGDIHSQAITLLIANGVRYTPDVAVLSKTESVFYEVKGFMRDDAAVKIKVAASVYPCFTFYLVTKRKKKEGGGWSIQQMLP